MRAEGHLPDAEPRDQGRQPVLQRLERKPSSCRSRITPTLNYDDLFSWAAVLSGRGFGLFPELQITHLISAKRLSRSHLLRLIPRALVLHGVLTCLLGLTQPRRINVIRYVRLILHGIKNGQFSARCQWTAPQGEDSAARFTAKNQLPPIDLSHLAPG